MRIVIAGAGAVGGYYGSILLKAGSRVSYLLTQRSLSIIKEKGLTVKSRGETWNVYPEVSADPADLLPCDLLIIAVKRYDTAELLRSIRPFIGSNTIILPLQNGVDSEDEVWRFVPGAKVLGGVAFIAARLEEPGVIQHMGAGSLSIGEVDESGRDVVKSIVQIFKDAGIPVKLSRNIHHDRWKKLCWNSVFNPLSVILDGPIDCILDSRDAIDVGYRIFHEIQDLADKKGIPLSPEIMEEYIKVTEKLRGFHTSMYEDFLKGKATEIDYFNGYICREGEKYNLSCPVNCTITALVKARFLSRLYYSK